jgi:transposase
MPRFKHIDMSPRFIALDLEEQLLPGTFEHALHQLIDQELSLAEFESRFRNDYCGAPAYPPAVLLKVVLLAYSLGIVSSRAIAQACEGHVLFIALSGDSQPHFTTIASFISTLAEPIAQVFTEVLLICDREGLIGREMFAIDGVKLPSNAAKSKSGTRAEFDHQASKTEQAVQVMLERHREEDARGLEPSLREREIAQCDRLSSSAKQIRTWLREHPEDRCGVSGRAIKSNRTDNESAKMATDKGVIQGYSGIAVVDAAHQIVVEAQAHGTAAEQGLLLPIVEAYADVLTRDSLITADAGYHSKDNLASLEAMNIQALIADPAMRKRDPRFADQRRHKAKPDPLYNKFVARARAKTRSGRYLPQDFTFDPEGHVCICPAGEFLYSNGRNCTLGGRRMIKFHGSQSTCGPCALRDQCIRDPAKTKTRQVAFFVGPAPGQPESAVDRMRRRIDTPEGRAQYGQRLATVEPVFANLRHNKGLNRFTLRGRTKVDAQWKLFCLVHNIEKLAKNGYAQ